MTETVKLVRIFLANYREILGSFRLAQLLFSVNKASGAAPYCRTKSRTLSPSTLVIVIRYRARHLAGHIRRTCTPQEEFGRMPGPKKPATKRLAYFGQSGTA